jgi:hypothetical protein
VSRVYGYPQITGYIDALDWLLEKSYWSGPDETPSGSREDHCGALRDINDDSLFPQSPTKVAEVTLQLADEQRRLVGRGYDGRIVRKEG